MQIAPACQHPPPPSSIINRPPQQQQLTPAPSLADEDYSKVHRPRSVSDPSHEDDYYFYHNGREGMTSRRSSVHSLGRHEDEPQRQSSDAVRLPPITSLLASVEPSPYATPREEQQLQFSGPPPPQPIPAPPPPQREPPSSHPYYSPPTSYPHNMPYRRQSIFSTYAASTPSPRVPNYPPPTSHHAPYRTPSPPYRPYPPPQHHPSHYPHSNLQPRPHPSLLTQTLAPPRPTLPPSSFALTHRTNSASPAERYMCHECNKSFSRPSSLRIHTFSHTGEKPFVCPEPGCTKRFSVRSNMRRHMKVHLETGATSGDTAEKGGDDDAGSETSATSPGQAVPMRARQGSRSSI